MCIKVYFSNCFLQDDILSFEEEKQAVYLQVYRPIYFQLVDVLLHKSHYPSQEDYASWSSEDKEQFRIYRLRRKNTFFFKSSKAFSNNNNNNNKKTVFIWHLS